MKRGMVLVVLLMFLLSAAACGKTQVPEELSTTADSLAQIPETEENTKASPYSEEEERQEEVRKRNILVAYFSATGNTAPLAEFAADILGADLYEIVPEQPYTDVDLDYYSGGRCDQEQEDPGARPAISGHIDHMEQYDTVIIGHPIWHGQAPRIISTFLESYDFSGKTLVTFCTSHSSGLGSSAENLHMLVPEDVSWLESRRFPAE